MEKYIGKIASKGSSFRFNLEEGWHGKGSETRCKYVLTSALIFPRCTLLLLYQPVAANNFLPSFLPRRGERSRFQFSFYPAGNEITGGRGRSSTIYDREI